MLYNCDILCYTIRYTHNLKQKNFENLAYYGKYVLKKLIKS